MGKNPFLVIAVSQHTTDGVPVCPKCGKVARLMMNSESFWAQCSRCKIRTHNHTATFPTRLEWLRIPR